MKAVYIGDSDELGLINGKIYEIVGEEESLDMYSVIDETGEDYMYPRSDFIIID